MACSGYPARCRVFCGRGRIRTCGASGFVCLRPLGHSPRWRAGPRLSNKHLDGLKTPACSPVHVSFVSVVEASVSELSSSVTGPTCSGFPWVQSCSAAFRTDYRVVVVSAHGLPSLPATSRCTWSRCRELSPSGELRLILLLRGSQGRGCPR